MATVSKLPLTARIVCSFCDHDQSEVAHMIAGKPGIAICDDCVAICVQTIIDKTRLDRGLAVKSGRKA